MKKGFHILIWCGVLIMVLLGVDFLLFSLPDTAILWLCHTTDSHDPLFPSPQTATEGRYIIIFNFTVLMILVILLFIEWNHGIYQDYIKPKFSKKQKGA